MFVLHYALSARCGKKYRVRSRDKAFFIYMYLEGNMSLGTQNPQNTDCDDPRELYVFRLIPLYYNLFHVV